MPQKRDEVHYNEVFHQLKQLESQPNRQVSEINRNLRDLLALSHTNRHKIEMVKHHGVRILKYFFEQPPTMSTLEYITAILSNLATCSEGRIEICSCKNSNCQSYHHRCIMYYLFKFVLDPKVSAVLQSNSMSAIMNCSISSSCKDYIDELSGTGHLLRILKNCMNEEVMLYAAGAMWNLCKSKRIVLKLETSHGTTLEELDKTMTRILISHVNMFQLHVTSQNERGLPGIIKCTGPNLTFAFSTLINQSQTILLRMEPFTDEGILAAEKNPLAFNKEQDESLWKKKDAETDDTGNALFKECPICQCACKPGAKQILLECQECLLCYHMECSRWYGVYLEQLNDRLKKKDHNKNEEGDDDEEEDDEEDDSSSSESFDEEDDDKSVIDKSKFYCNNCYKRQPALCYTDFLADHPKSMQGKYVMTKNQFDSCLIRSVEETKPLIKDADDENDNLVGQKPKLQLIMIEDSLWVLGLGEMVHEVVKPKLEKFNVVRLCYKTQGVTKMFQLKNSVDKNDSLNHLASWEFNFYDEKRSSKTHGNIRVGDLMIWPSSGLLELNTEEHEKRTLKELEECYSYAFETERQGEYAYAFGTTAAQLIRLREIQSAETATETAPPNTDVTVVPFNTIAITNASSDSAMIHKSQTAQPSKNLFQSTPIKSTSEGKPRRFRLSIKPTPIAPPRIRDWFVDLPHLVWSELFPARTKCTKKMMECIRDKKAAFKVVKEKKIPKKKKPVNHVKRSDGVEETKVKQEDDSIKDKTVADNIDSHVK